MSDRYAIRALIKTGLETAVTLGQAFYAYPEGNIQGQSPVLTVMSAGSERGDQTFHGLTKTFRYVVTVLVLIHEKSSNTYTYEDAEDLLDQVEQQIADWVHTNDTNTNDWISVQYTAPTSQGVWDDVSGNTYRYEQIELVVEAR